VQRIARPVFLLHTNRRLEQQLRNCIRDPMTLISVSDWGDLSIALSRTSPTALCIVDPRGSGTPTSVPPTLSNLIQQFPTVAIVAAFRVEVTDAPLLKSLFSAGVADVIDLAREQSDLAIRRRVDEVRSRWAVRLLGRALPPTVPSRARALLTIICEVAADGGQVPDLAAALNIDERTVPRWCDRAGLPQPRRLLVWVRLLLAAELFDTSDRSVDSIARACGYSGAVSLNFSIRSLLDLTPTELRRRGAFENVSERFRAELRAAREAARQAGRTERAWLN
jgi:AraC-like DNA-binding protein